MNETADKGQGVSSRFADSAEGGYAPIKALLVKLELPPSLIVRLEDHQDFRKRPRRGITTKSTTRAHKSIFSGADSEELPRDDTEKLWKLAKLVS